MKVYTLAEFNQTYTIKGCHAYMVWERRILYIGVLRILVIRYELYLIKIEENNYLM